MNLEVFIALAGDNTISNLTFDYERCLFTKRVDIPISGGPAPMVFTPNNQRIYVGLRGSCEIGVLVLDQNTNELTLIQRIPLPSDPCRLSMDKSGRFLFSAYFKAGEVAVHRITDDGRLEPQPTDRRKTGNKAHDVLTDRDNRFVHVPHVGKYNSIHTFGFDSQNGRLSKQPVFTYSPPNLVGPRHICLHPHKDLFYVSNEQGCSVTVFSFDKEIGKLRALQTLSTLPWWRKMMHKNLCAQIRISHDGQRLLVSNRGYNSIASFTVEKDSGLLSNRILTSTEPTPRAFDIDQSGSYCFVASIKSGKLQVFQIAEDSSKLSLVCNTTVGSRPMWVKVVRPT